ncbi:MAG: sulfurtransferase TusA family protein [Desulfuromonadaceae bacterium]|jgi:TusA-related sulfurtransferase
MKHKAPEELLYDIRGQVCPSSLLMTLKEVNLHRHKLKAGQLSLRVLTDSRDATQTIPKMVTSMGFKVSVAKQEGSYSILIEKEH